MSELLLKFNQLNDFQRQEVLDFINFLLTKSKQKQQEFEESQGETEDAYDFFESAGLMKNRDINADQLRRDAWKIKP